MTSENPEVKDVERIEITPAPEGDETVEVGDTTPDSSQDENDGSDEDDSKKPDELVKPTPPADTTVQTPDGDGLREVEGETPRERALRLEVTTLKGKLRQERGQEIFGSPALPPVKKEMSPEKVAILSKFKPEEINSLREVLPVLAEEMGFVNKDELQGTTYTERAQDALDTFLDKHPEYTPENDKDGTLWNAFKTEYSLYKTPTDPKDFPKIFERIHRDVFGIKPAGALKTVNAQREKAQVASHAGSSSANPAPQARAQAPASGLRLDMLKGFTDEEKVEMTE